MPLAVLRRRAAALVGLLALALAAGPAASAACAYAGEMPMHGASPPEVAHAGMTHAGMNHEAPAETPPCHGDAPEAPPAPDAHDCASVCCASEPPAPFPPAPTVASADVPTPVVTEVAAPEGVAPVADVPPTPSPPRPTRLHVEIGRFLI